MSLIETRSGGNATGLPGGRLSRRSALQGSAAAALALAAGATAAQSAAANDSPLIDLAHHLGALAIREREAWERLSKAEDAVFKATPPTPTRHEMAKPSADLDGLSPEQRLSKLLADPTDFWAASTAADAEHKTALAEHARVVEKVEDRHGLSRLQRQALGLTAQATEASQGLAVMVATTPAGVAAKARVLLAFASDDPLLRPAEFDRHAALLASLLQDAARFGTGGLRD